MFAHDLAHILLLSIVAISILLMLVRPSGIAEVYWIGGGVALLLLLRLIPLSLAGRAAGKGTDVYLFLAGMMLLSELARECGVFDWLASVVVRSAKGSSPRLFAWVYAAGTLVTIFMSNDATAVVLTPAILAAIRRARVEALPYLFTCAFIANAASFVLPISNPANLVVFHADMPPLGQWLEAFCIPSLVSISSTYLILRWVFRKQLQVSIEHTIAPAPLTADGKLVLGAVAGMVVVLLTASALHMDLGLPTCIAALVITGIISVKSRINPLLLMRAISWGTLGLVAGLFVLVDAVESIGGMKPAQLWLEWAQSLAPATGAMVVGFFVGIANNLINNLPLGLIAGSTLQAAHIKGLLANCVLIGVDLGPNLSITGSLATILWLLALRKENLNVTFRGFLRVGVVAMPFALLLSIGSAVLVNFLTRFL